MWPFKSSSSVSNVVASSDDECPDVYDEIVLLSKKLERLIKFRASRRSTQTSSRTPSRSSNSTPKTPGDASSTQCYKCHKYGHYANKFRK